MTLVPLVDPQDADPIVRDVLDEAMARYGQALATWRALLHRPPILATYLPYLRAVGGPGVVDQRTKDLAALRVAVLNHCRYTTSHRARAAQASGATADDLAAVASGNWSRLAPQDQLALEYATQLTERPTVVDYRSSAQAVDDGVLQRLRDTFSDPQIVELTASIGLWNALSRFHRVMGFELDMDPPPPTLDEVL